MAAVAKGWGHVAPDDARSGDVFERVLEALTETPAGGEPGAVYVSEGGKVAIGGENVAGRAHQLLLERCVEGGPGEAADDGIDGARFQAMALEGAIVEIGDGALVEVHVGKSLPEDAGHLAALLDGEVLCIGGHAAVNGVGKCTGARPVLDDDVG